MAVYKDTIRTKHVCQIGSDCSFIKNVRDELGLYKMQFSKTNVISVAEFVYAVEMVADMFNKTDIACTSEFIDAICTSEYFMNGEMIAFLEYILERLDGTFTIEYVDVYSQGGESYFQIDEVVK